MNVVQEFIGQRRARDEERIGELLAEERDERDRAGQRRAEIEALYREIQDLERVSRAIDNLPEPQQKPAPGPTEEEAPLTIKGAVLAVLADAPQGLIALDILRRINQRFGLGLVRTSLSPQLTRLKKAGAIDLHGSIWTTGPKFKKAPSKPADGETEIGPEAHTSGP